MSVHPASSEVSVNLADAAARLSVSLKTIRRLIEDGQLPAQRLGPRLVRIKVADLDALGEQVNPSAGAIREAAPRVDEAPTLTAENSATMRAVHAIQAQALREAAEAWVGEHERDAHWRAFLRDRATSIDGAS